jgi:hypothetical protein
MKVPCPDGASVGACALLALSPLGPGGIAVMRIDFDHNRAHHAQPQAADGSARVKFGTFSVPHPEMYAPVTRGAVDAESFRFSGTG